MKGFKLRKVVLFISLIVLCIYFAVMFFINLNEISDRELEQATFQMTEYLAIVNEFATDMSDLGGKYLELDDARIDKGMEAIEYSDNYTFGSVEQLMDFNRRIVGRGTKYTVERDKFYINLAYIYDGFFRDFCSGFSDIVSMDYFSEHNFIYTYSNVGADYLSKIGYYTEREQYLDTLEKLGDRRDVIWQYENDNNYSNKREIIASIPVYEGDRLEGLIDIRYSLELLDSILANNFYQTYLINSEGIIISSNVKKANKYNEFINIKDSEMFGDTKGQKIIDYAFEKDKNQFDDFIDYFKVSNVIENEYVLFVYVPAYNYFLGIIYSIISMFVISKIAIWLENTYQRINVIRAELDKKYGEVTELKVELEHASKVDFLTNLYNRRYLLDRLSDEKLINTNNKDANFVIILIDIDHFKNVNDTYGHSAGDEVLKTISTVLVNNVREDDLVARWGGEELLIVLVNLDYEQGKAVAEKIRKKVEEAVTVTQTDKITVTISAGVANIKMTENFDTALTNTDSALYFAKSSGRNKIVFFEDIKDSITNE